jgi:hypothetical protein
VKHWFNINGSKFRLGIVFALLSVLTVGANIGGTRPTKAACGMLPLLGVGSFCGGGGGCSPGTTATAFLARTSGLNPTYTAAYCNLLNGMDSNSLTAKFDALFILGSQDSTTAGLNLIANTFAPTLNSFPTFTANKGYVGADSSTFISIDTGIQLGVNTTQCSPPSSWPVSIVVQDNLQATSMGGACMGISPSGHQTRLFPWYSDGNQYWDVVSTTQNTGVAVSSSKGRYVVNRSGSSADQLYKNGSSIATSTTSGDSSPVSQDLYVLAVNGGTGASAFGCGNYIGAYGVSSSLSSGQVATFDGLLAAFGSAVGWP